MASQRSGWMFSGYARRLHGRDVVVPQDEEIPPGQPVRSQSSGNFDQLIDDDVEMMPLSFVDDGATLADLEKLRTVTHGLVLDTESQIADSIRC